MKTNKLILTTKEENVKNAMVDTAMMMFEDCLCNDDVILLKATFDRVWDNGFRCGSKGLSNLEPAIKTPPTFMDVFNSKVIEANVKNLTWFSFDFENRLYLSEWRKGGWCYPFEIIKL